MTRNDTFFNLGRVPFSRFGSWMVMDFRSGNRLILKNVHNRGKDLFLLTPMADGQPLEYKLTMTATRLTVETEHGHIAFCFASADTLRIKGYPDFAKEIAKRFCALCERSGFAENFDALTGAPLCDPAYTWTASVFLLMLKRKEV